MKPATWITIALASLAAVWFSWMFRYAPVGQALFLDRWTGEMVSGFDGERFDLRQALTRANVFEDLIPPKNSGTIPGHSSDNRR